MNVTFRDCIDLLRVLVWPAIAGAGMVLFRTPLSSFLRSLGNRVRRLSVFQVELELSTLPEFTSTWSAPNLSDVRQLTPANEFSSQATALLDQIRDDSGSDYAVVDLGTGQQWLTSRLFIFAILLQRMRGLQCFVFVETRGDARRQFIGMATPEGVRWGLAQRYPWLEEAFAKTYAQLASYQIQSDRGALDSWQATQLVQGFLTQIQQIAAPLTDPVEWVSISTQPLWEHAKWLDGSRLERVLHNFLGSSSMPEFLDLPNAERAKVVLRRRGSFVALLEKDGRFKNLVDRGSLLEELGQRFVRSFDLEPMDSAH